MGSDPTPNPNLQQIAQVRLRARGEHVARRVGFLDGLEEQAGAAHATARDGGGRVARPLARQQAPRTRLSFGPEGAWVGSGLGLGLA